MRAPSPPPELPPTYRRRARAGTLRHSLVAGRTLTRISVSRRGNTCDTEIKHFVRMSSSSCASFATVVRARDTSGPFFSAGPCALSPRWRSHPESPGDGALCALILLVVPATAQSTVECRFERAANAPPQHHEEDQQVLRFLDKHRWLLSDPRFEADAKRQLRLHTLSLAHTKKMAAKAKRALAARAKVQAKVRHLAAVEAAKPETSSAACSARTAGRPSRSRAASPACPRQRKTASISGSSRWARMNGSSSVTALRPSSRRRRPTGTSSPPVVAGAPGRASPGADSALERFVCKVRDTGCGPGSFAAHGVVGVHLWHGFDANRNGSGSSTRRPRMRGATAIATTPCAS